MRQIEVLVVGAGPVGLAAANLLAARGVPTLVLERRAEAHPLPRAVHLDDESHRILQTIGVHEEFARISRPCVGLRLLDGAHRPMAEFRRTTAAGRHGYPEANFFHQPDLEALLHARLTNWPAAQLRGNAEVTAVEPATTEGDAPVRVSVRDVVTGQISHYATSAVLGCDGARSVTRTAIGARLCDLGFTEDWLVVDVICPAPPRAWDGVDQVCDPDRPATFMRVDAHRYRFEARLRPGDDVARLTDRAGLARTLAPWAPGIGAEQIRVVRAARYTFAARLADRWRHGRVFLLGDAAHLTPPFIGQGLGSGLRDAHNLTWKLARVLAGEADEALLDSYQAERRPHARRMIRLAVITGWAMTGGQDRVATARRAALATASRLPGFARVALRSLSPPLRAGPLVRRRWWAPRALDGSICPQPWVRLAERDHRFDDLLGPGFALLACAPPGPSLRALTAAYPARVVLLAGPPPAATGHRVAADRTLAWPSPRACPAPSTLTGDELTIEDDGTLRAWLHRARAHAVLLRPDRVVLRQFASLSQHATETDAGRICRNWPGGPARLLHSRG